ncbi:Na/Pi cotransporter family protein [Patescibacteria group bacterium]|nr:Na/Pi cotransporter family protein [Patescibacteria group bacterium]
MSVQAIKTISKKVSGNFFSIIMLVIAASFFVFVKFPDIDKLGFDLRKLIFTVAGGLALFLFGMNYMSTALKRIAGYRLKIILQKLTKNSIIGLLLGMTATSVLQSSSAITVMVVSFVNAGFMHLKQAVAVIMGANIGTTITAQIIAFNLDIYALPIVAIGVFLLIFSKRDQLKYIGEVLTGFGILFFGLSLMKEELIVIKDLPAISDGLMTFAKYPILGLLSGAFFTFIIQSSSATIGITIAMASAGAIPLESAIPIILGLNIGTTITANIAAINANANAKRVARIHFMFNVLAAALFLLFLPQFTKMVEAVSYIIWQDASTTRMVANAHTFFNVMAALIFFPFIALLVKASYFLVPKSAKEKELAFLDDSSALEPTVALDHSRLAISKMHKMTQESYSSIKKFIFNQNEEEGKKILVLEEKLDEYQEKILDYVGKSAKMNLTDEQSGRLSRHIHMVNHYEQIGDCAENIHEVVTKMIARDIEFSVSQKRDLRLALKKVNAMLVITKKMFSHVDKPGYEKVIEPFDDWQKTKDEILLNNRNLSNRKNFDIEKINFFIDLVLSLNEIAKKYKNISWEASA